MMKKTIFIAAVLGVFAFGKTMAQDISNDDLYKYAIVMETKNMFQSELSSQITEYVEGQAPEIKNRYNALAGGEAPANDSEKQFIDQVNKMKSERSGEFGDAFKTMIKRVLGAETYSAVKKGVANDAAVKERYNMIVQAIESAPETASASAGE